MILRGMSLFFNINFFGEEGVYQKLPGNLAGNFVSPQFFSLCGQLRQFISVFFKNKCKNNTLLHDEVYAFLCNCLRKNTEEK